MVCSVAGWGRQGKTTIPSKKLYEVELEIQFDEECKSRYKDSYNSTIEICVGNSRKIQSSFKVRSSALPMATVGVAEL